MKLTLESIIPVITAIVTYIFGLLAKKFNWYESKYIPVQNFIIGVLSAMIFYLSTPDVEFMPILFTVLSGFMAGGIYDISKTRNKDE